jgi:hypothetical protein
MPIIIWGSRGITSTKETGEFYCPKCDSMEEYRLKQVRPFFTIYFIPLFPIGAATRYVECRCCRGTFREEVLDYEPPSESDRLARRVYEELRTGTSVEVLRRKLTDHGMKQTEADELLDKMCDGHAKQCACGHSFHPQVRKCSHCGEAV